MATKKEKELARTVKRLQEEVRRQDEKIKKLVTQLSLVGVRALRPQRSEY